MNVPHIPANMINAKKSMHITHRWLEDAANNLRKPKKIWLSAIHYFYCSGNLYIKDLRKESAEFISSCNLEGNAIGGLSVGEPNEIMYEMTETVCSILP